MWFDGSAFGLMRAPLSGESARLSLQGWVQILVSRRCRVRTRGICDGETGQREVATRQWDGKVVGWMQWPDQG